MIPKHLTAILILLGCCFSAFSQTFTVTTNADSGPGSLREAITLANANGTATTDYIHFNIPSTTETGRTINLQSQLPDLSSNITIDGTTQPGGTLGYSNAKVTLFIDHFIAYEFTYLFIKNASDVKIYGLCFRFFDNPDAAGGDTRGIGLRNSKNITVGAKGKGNLFTSVKFSVSNNYNNFYTDSVRFVTIQGNVMGLNSQGLNAKRGTVHLSRAADITVGGPTPEDGNIFVGAHVTLNQHGIVNSNFFALVQNNKFNLNWDGSKYYNEGGSIDLWGNTTDDTTTTKTFVLDNVISSDWPGGIGLTQIFHKAIVQGNKVGTDIKGTYCIGAYNQIGVSNCKKVTIGGYGQGEENIIASSILTQPRGVNIIKNKLGWIQVSNSTNSDDPFCKIVTYDNGLITGKANPNSKIQLYTNTCNFSCLERAYLTTIFTDASGNWSFPYTASMPNIVATATTPDSSTSEFTAPDVDHSKYKIVNATCGKSNGSITGIVVKEGTHIKWLNGRTLQVVSTDTNLINFPAGYYILNVSNGENGCKWNINLSINDFSLPATISPQVIDASCGQNNGSLAIPQTSNITYKWMNAQMDSVGTGNSKNNLVPGTYYLKAWVSYDSACYKIYGPFTVKNLTGPSLNTAAVQITAATCSNTNGSIKGITGQNITGTPFLQWVDSTNKPVGNGYDLINIKGGKYRFKFKDATGCDTIITTFYIVPDNGSITIDASAKKITESSCAGSTGSISGLIVNGGNIFKWINTADNSIVGTAADVSALPPGNYSLTVTNDLGCSKTSPVINIPQSTFSAIDVTGAAVNDALCESPTGALKINTFSKDHSTYTFSWVDEATGQVVGAGLSLNNLNPGTFSLLAKDGNSCEKKIYTATIKAIPKPVFNYNNVQVKDDNCNLNEGSISGMQVTGLKGPTVYTWYDQDNNIAGNGLNLQNKGSGTYILKVSDAGICNIQSNPVIINNTNEALAAPLYKDLLIPRFTDAELEIKNPASGDYILSADAAGAILLQQNTNGDFIIKNVTSDTSVYIKRVKGTCTSPVSKVNIKVVDRSYFAIPTAFTPNGDGKNDRLTLRVIGHIQVKHFRIYNRWGQIVFETSKLNAGWDGTSSGALQNSGVYVWVAEGIDISGNRIQDKGSFMLIR